MGFFLYFEILNRIILDLLIHEYRVHKKEKNSGTCEYLQLSDHMMP